MPESVALRSHVRLKLLAAAAALPLLFLTACSGASGDSGPGKPPSNQASTPSETPTPTPSPTPSATYKPASAEGPAENVPVPVMPEEAKAETKEGLEAFARYWYEAASYGYETGDVGYVQSVSSPECSTCRNYYEVVTNGFSGDDWIAKGKIEVQDALSEFVQTPEGRFQVLVMYQQDDTEYYGPGGQQSTDDGDAAPAVQLFEATYGQGRWLLVNLATMDG